MNGIAIKKILVPTDLSQNSEYAMQYAKEFADKLGAKLYIYHCVTDLQSAIGYVPSLPAEEIIRTMKEEAIKEIEHIRNRYNFGDVEVVIESGNAPKKIVEFADKNNIDMIIMGAHGKSGLERFMFGSVTEKVLRLSSKPVLAIKMSS